MCNREFSRANKTNHYRTKLHLQELNKKKELGELKKKLKEHEDKLNKVKELL